jgi:hypothetical protein
MKTTKHLSLLIFLFISYTSVSQELISASGNSHQSGNMHITWSLGELMTETFSSPSNLLTQGFNQPQLTVTNVPVNEINDFTVLLYPNPTHSFINIQIDDTRNDEFRIYAIDGRLLATEEISGSITTVDFQQFESGIYLVKILRDQSHIKTFQIIKN